MKDWFGRGIWFLVGMFLVIMGLYFLIHPDAALVSIAWLLGAAMLVSGASDLVVYLARHRAYIASGWFLADGIIDLLLGLLFVCNSWLAAELLSYAPAGWAILSGVIKCVGAAIYRRAGMLFWGAPLAIGLVILIFGLATFFKPDIAAIAISAVVAVVLMAQGLMAVMRGLFASSLHR